MTNQNIRELQNMYSQISKRLLVFYSKSFFGDKFCFIVENNK